MPNKVRIGFVGCGGNGRGHLSTLSQMDNVQILGVCDVQQSLAQAAAEQTGARAYTDFTRLLDGNELDAVYLSVPPFAHGEMEFALIERGIPFYVEKPVTLDVKLGCRIAEAIRAKNLLTAAGYQFAIAPLQPRREKYFPAPPLAWFRDIIGAEPDTP